MGGSKNEVWVKLLWEHQKPIFFRKDGSGDFRDWTKTVAGYANAMGLGPTLIQTTDRYLFSAALFACWYRGVAPLLPQNHQPGSLESLIHSERVAVVIDDVPPSHTADDLDILNWIFEDHNKPSDVACTLFTSGSTGCPQAHHKTFSQLFLELHILEQTFYPQPMDRCFLSMVPVHHMYGLLFSLLLPMRIGAMIVSETLLFPDQLQPYLHLPNQTLIAVPTLLNLLCASSYRCSFERVFASAAPLASTVRDRFANAMRSPITEIYGSTETGGIAHRTHEHAWRPFHGISIREVDGTLSLHSPFAPSQPYQTADQIRILDDGFELLGRKDGVIKVGGKRLVLNELSSKALELPQITDAHCLLKLQDGHEPRGRHLHLFVVCNSEFNRNDFIQSLSEWFDSSLVPRNIHRVDSIPRINGKVQEHLLRQSLNQPLTDPNGAPSFCILIPCYNNPITIEPTVRHLRHLSLPIVVIDDGSNESTKQALHALPAEVVLLTHKHNQGKGAAVKTGLAWAHEQGHTHALQVDADGQHNLDDAARFIETSRNHPTALVLGTPVYDASLPLSRKLARGFNHLWTRLETRGAIKDGMVGYRVYPVSITHGLNIESNRMDFDVEVAVRLAWKPVPIQTVQTSIRYLSIHEGGVSHFQVFRDNLRISRLHAKLCIRLIWQGVRQLFK